VPPEAMIKPHNIMSTFFHATRHRCSLERWCSVWQQHATAVC